MDTLTAQQMATYMAALPVTQKLQKELPPANLIGPAESWLYPPELKAWHTDTRGYDGPKRELMKNGRHHAAFEKPVVVAFHTQDNPDIPLLVSGAFVPPHKDNSGLRCLESQWLNHSQVPCLRFKVTRGAIKAPAFVWIFARDIQPATTTRDGCKLACTHTIDNNYESDPHPNTGIALDSSHAFTTWETKISVGPLEHSTSDNTSPMPLCPNGLKTTGIEPNDLRQILEVGNLAPEKGELGELSSGDWALWGLLSTNVFHIYRTWPKGDNAKQVFDYFTSYMTAQLNHVAEHGYWPHYRRQAAHLGIPFDEFTTDLRIFESPRHMVREWRLKYVNGIPVQAQPEKWAGYHMYDAYPDVRTKAFALRVEAERKTGIERALFPKACIPSDGKIMHAGSTQQQHPAFSDYLLNDKAKLDWSKNPRNPEYSEAQSVYRQRGSFGGDVTGKSKRRQDVDRQESAKKPRLGH